MVAKFFHIQSLQDASQLPKSPSIKSRRFKAVFLVPIKALVDQQCEAFRKVFIDQSDSILKAIDNQAGER
jgi:replicative superfamily II helicase